MTKIIPLPIYPSAPTGDDLSALKKAKAKIHTDTLIKPVRALPKSPGRIIAIRQKPNFLCDYAFIENPTPETLQPALEWVLGKNETFQYHGVITTLQEIFGAGVEEITNGESM